MSNVILINSFMDYSNLENMNLIDNRLDYLNKKIKCEIYSWTIKG